jgi:hypothetical protein
MQNLKSKLKLTSTFAPACWKFTQVAPDLYADTCILQISSQDCMPPFSYCKILSKLGHAILKTRATGCLWIQVHSPGLWFPLEVRRGLRDLKLPVAVTLADTTLTLSDFNVLPWTSRKPLSPGPIAASWNDSVSIQEVNCLRVLARLKSASTEEIASLAGFSTSPTFKMLTHLEVKKYISHVIPRRINGEFIQKFDYIHPYWRPTRVGVSIALRSWHVLPGTLSTWRLEAAHGEGNRHRRTARRWVGYLKRDLGEVVEIWVGWTEVFLAGLHVVPDALAWGRMEGIETLFWLEVESGHISGEKVIQNTIRRFQAASHYAAEREVRLVFAVMGRPWVRKVVQTAFKDIRPEEAVIIGDWKDFGQLAGIRWGSITQAGAGVLHRRKSPFSPAVKARLG